MPKRAHTAEPRLTHPKTGVPDDDVFVAAAAQASSALVELVRELARRSAQQRFAEARRQLQQAHGQTAGQPNAVG
jgi:hypothetical protein